MFQKLRHIFSTKHRDVDLQKQLEELRKKTPVPVFWLFGKTQTGKTTIIKFLTGADDAEIGQGFRPCTRFSREYYFPTEEAPLLKFVDTRGLDEPGYDPAEDIARFNDQAHIVVVTVKALDHAQERIVSSLREVRRSKPGRPVVLTVTCLHEAYPQQQHPVPYEAVGWTESADHNGQAALPIPQRLKESLDEQRRRFEGLYDYFVPIDLTPPEEGFNDPNYGSERLKQVLLDALPGAYRQTLITLDMATHELTDLYARHALPRIVAYSSLAATAGAIPIPWVDLLIIPGIQSRMIYHLSAFYGQELSAERFLELASTLGLGLAVRQATRELVKLIPYVGSVVGAALAGASTFALGKAFCYYYSAVHRGQVPRAEDLKKYYQEQLALAEQAWKKKKEP